MYISITPIPMREIDSYRVQLRYENHGLKQPLKNTYVCAGAESAWHSAYELASQHGLIPRLHIYLNKKNHPIESAEDINSYFYSD